jgi:2,4-dienoyl-CoA reductase-like NADH-dependent reductase (Old Yellow Enzyme family)/thioredoxin reductase/putative sterol carrier protein
MKLFEPFVIKGLQLRNRIVMPGMDTNFGDEEGNPAAKTYRYYEQRARGGVGLIIVEGAYFDRRGSGTQNMLSIENDRKIEALSKLAQTIKENGAGVLLQIYHAGSQASSFMIGLKPVAPSDVPFQMSGEVPVALKRRQIKRIVRGYVEACKRASRAGFNGVEIHAGHGYLLGQFFSPLTNRRRDGYGGSFENRIRMHVEVLRAVRKRCGDDFIVCFRINGRDYIEGGAEIEETCRLAQRLEEEGVDLINITGGIFDSPGFPVVPYMSYPRGVFSDAASAVKRAVTAVPVCVVGRINTPEAAESILKEEKADLVAIGRGLITDPAFALKAKEGRDEEIRPCIGCNACLNQIMTEQSVACSINPDLLDADGQIDTATDRKRVLIIGAGVAGLEAARIASVRGHEVLLIEKNGTIGGNLRLASVAPMKSEVGLLIPYYESLLQRLPIELRLNTAFNSSILREFEPDAVVLATGSVAEPPNIEGLSESSYSLYNQVLGGDIPSGRRIIVLRGGMIGIEVAEYLCSLGKSVTILESGRRLGADLYALVAREVMRLVEENGCIHVQVETKPERISDGRLICSTAEGTISVDFDHIVVALGRRPCPDLFEDYNSQDLKVGQIYRIGDCKKPGMIFDAVHEANRVAMAIGEKQAEQSGREQDSGDTKIRMAGKIKKGAFTVEDIPDYLRVLVEACNCNPKIQRKSRKARLGFQFTIAGSTDYWITIDRGVFSTGEGQLDHPDVTIQMDGRIAPGIFSGEVNAASAYMTKDLSFCRSHATRDCLQKLGQCRQAGTGPVTDSYVEAQAVEQTFFQHLRGTIQEL